MSFIDSENIEKCITNASFDALEKALKAYGYKVTRTNMQLTASHGGYWSTNGHISTITIVDKGDYRECQDIESSKGYMCSPASGILAKIISYAENSDMLEKNAVVSNPTTEQQSGVWIAVALVCGIMIIGTIIMLCMLF